METRPEYVELCELEVLGRALAEGNCPTELELAIGFECFDETLRNRTFKKGLDLNRLRALAEDMAPYGYRLKCYFMLKPVPEFDDEAAIADVHAAIVWLGALAQETGVRIDLHLNPTYVARGTALETDFAEGRFTPPRLIDAARAAQPAGEHKLSIFIGLSDEGLAVPGGSFIREGDEHLVAELERFNRSQDFGILEELITAKV
jgi:radical SAM enzyme (TIGR01210 family)